VYSLKGSEYNGSSDRPGNQAIPFWYTERPTGAPPGMFLDIEESISFTLIAAACSQVRDLLYAGVPAVRDDTDAQRWLEIPHAVHTL
jgi:hypothetical protein